MECNREEAIRAMDIAKMKVTENDYYGAKKFAEKAQNLYPMLEGLKQVSMMIDVYITAGNKICGGESDWYGILGVDPLADEDVVKKQYRRLALLLHPDKNKCKGAEDAFKLVLEAWSLLSDKVKRIAYDQKRKSKDVKQRKPRKPKQAPNQPKQQPSQQTQPANKRKQPPHQRKQAPNQPKQPPEQQQQPPNQQRKPPNQQQQPPNQQQQPPNQQKQPQNQQKQPPNQEQQSPNKQKPTPNQQKQPQNQQKQPPNQEQQSPNKQKQTPNQPSSSGSRNGRGRSNKPTPKVSTFWTMCNKCCTPYEYVRVYYLNKTVRCRNCLGSFVATENQKTPTENQKTPTEKEKTPQATDNTNGVSSCKRDLSQTVSGGNGSQRNCSVSGTVNSNSRNVTNQAEESIKRGAEESQDVTGGIANSGLKLEERVFKKLKTNDYAEASGGIKV